MPTIRLERRLGQRWLLDVVHEVPEAAKPGTIKIGTTVGTVQPEVTEQKAA
jgi:hypothetical protein